MAEFNLPPFYISQRVVFIAKTNSIHTNGEKYTVAENVQCPNCGKWHTLTKEPHSNHLGDYTCEYVPIKRTVLFGSPSSAFAPIQENFQSISLNKVLEVESRLISQN